MRKFGWATMALGLLMVLALAATGVSAQAATGTIKGKLINKSATGESVGSLSVDLLAFTSTGQHDKRTATAGV
ncbi:MAG: hypothetical protein ACYC7H_08015, partial [Chloroflexota bacterium]